MEISPNAGLQSAFQSGVEGFNKASQEITQTSQSIASRSTSGQETSEPLEGQSVESVTAPQSTSVTDDIVQLAVSQREAEANARSIQTADQTIGSFIDELV